MASTRATDRISFPQRTFSSKMIFKYSWTASLREFPRNFPLKNSWTSCICYVNIQYGWHFNLSYFFFSKHLGTLSGLSSAWTIAGPYSLTRFSCVSIREIVNFRLIPCSQSAQNCWAEGMELSSRFNGPHRATRSAIPIETTGKIKTSFPFKKSRERPLLVASAETSRPLCMVLLSFLLTFDVDFSSTADFFVSCEVFLFRIFPLDFKGVSKVRPFFDDD